MKTTIKLKCINCKKDFFIYEGIVQDCSHCKECNPNLIEATETKKQTKKPTTKSRILTLLISIAITLTLSFIVINLIKIIK